VEVSRREGYGYRNARSTRRPKSRSAGIGNHPIVVFRVDFDLVPTAAEIKVKHYYVQESVGIGTGFLLAAPHERLDGTDSNPRPGEISNQILRRPKNERPSVLIPVGFPAPDAAAPDIGKKEHWQSEGGPMAPFPKKQP
jgi:hypothetical protein